MRVSAVYLAKFEELGATELDKKLAARSLALWGVYTNQPGYG